MRLYLYQNDRRPLAVAVTVTVTVNAVSLPRKGLKSLTFNDESEVLALAAATVAIIFGGAGTYGDIPLPAVEGVMYAVSCEQG